MLRILKVLVILGCSLVFACEEEQRAVTDPTAATDTLTVALGASAKREVVLSQVSREYLEAFDEYAILREAAHDLNGKTVAEIKSEIDAWSESALQFYKIAQDSTFEQPIESRILLLYTKSRILQQEVASTRLDTSAVKMEATEFYNTFQDLNNQFNVKFLQSVDDFLEEFREGAGQFDENSAILQPNKPPARGTLPLRKTDDSTKSQEL